MSMVYRRWAATAAVMALVLAALQGPALGAPAKTRVTILGGPPAGVFGIFATGIAT